MKQITLFVIYVTITTGRLFSQETARYYSKELDRYGVKFTQPKEFTETKAGTSIHRLFAHPLYFKGYGFDTPRSRVYYTSPWRYKFGENDLPENMLRADRIRYLIEYNRNGDRNANLDIDYLIGRKTETAPSPHAEQIIFIGAKEARKRFNADSILMYTIPVEGQDDFKYCTSMVLFKNPITINIILLLPEEELKNQDQHLAALDKTIWFANKRKTTLLKGDPRTHVIPSGDSLRSERILKRLKKAEQNRERANAEELYLTIDQYAKQLLMHNIDFIPPKGFKESKMDEKTLKGAFYSVIPSNGYLALRSGDKECMTVYSDILSPRLVAMILRLSDSTASLSQIHRKSITRSLQRAYDSDALPDDYLTVHSGKQAEKQFNADSVYIYPIPIRNKSLKPYTHGVAVTMMRFPAQMVGIYMLLTDKGYKKVNEYMSKIDRTVLFPGDPKDHTERDEDPESR